MTLSRVGRANSSTPSFDGLTPLHLAVLQGSYAQVRSIVRGGKHGVNAQTATKTTPLMLAALYGRSDIFLYLLKKKASPNNRDSKGNTPLNYAEPGSAFLRNLLRQYKSIATKSPDTSMRRDISVMLKAIRAIRHKSKKAYAKGRADARARAEVEPTLQASASMDQIGQQQSLHDPARRTVFLQSPDGKQLDFVEVRRLARIERNSRKTKCIGLICAADENDTQMFAISGWGTARDKNFTPKNVLNNTEYTVLVMRVAPLLNFTLVGSGLDHNFPGTASEKKGAFWACHAEKQLAVFVLKKALSYVSCTGELTENNLDLLKNQLDKLPPGLRETKIHLNHEIACRNCVRFLKFLTQKTGLIFQIEFHKWYIEGKRSRMMKLEPDGSFKQVTEAAKHYGPDDNADVIDDELGILDDDDATNTDVQCDSVDQDGGRIMPHSAPATPVMPTSRRPGLKRQMSLGLTHRKGSPANEEPKKDPFRYSVPIVTPPSKKAQALPTPQSHARFTEIPRITTSPSPAGMSSSLGPATQSDSMSLSQEYEVEEILQSDVESGVQWYLVKWRGYPDDNNSWERESNLKNAPDAIGKYWEELRAVVSQTQDMDN